MGGFRPCASLDLEPDVVVGDEEEPDEADGGNGDVSGMGTGSKGGGCGALTTLGVEDEEDDEEDGEATFA